MMYNEKLSNLIEMALMDGELTEKEKQILFKNAESLGIDLDEFEMVLEAKLFEKQKSLEKEQPKTTVAPKSDKYGDIKKCPSCGAMVQSFQTKCIDCGHEYRNIETSSSIEKLFKMLNDVEDTREEVKPRGLLHSVLPGLDNNSSATKTDQKKMTIISNFPIPNTKDDILEFLSLAVPKSKKIGNIFTNHNNKKNELHNEFATIWKAKCEQIIMKARFSMKEDKKTLDEINQYANALGIK